MDNIATRNKMTTTAHSPTSQDRVDAILAYHDQTKHHPERYARGPGGLDWATQPNPFRRFEGSPVCKLPLAHRDDTGPNAALFGAGAAPPRPFSLAALGLFFELSLGLSARKETSGLSWYLRVNPSTGTLTAQGAVTAGALSIVPNAMSAWPTAPASPGAISLVNSNGTLYELQSGAGGVPLL